MSNKIKSILDMLIMHGAEAIPFIGGKEAILLTIWR